MRKIIAGIAALSVALGISLAMPAMVSAAFDPLGDVCNNPSVNNSSSTCGTSGEDPLAGPDGAIVDVTSILALVAGIVSVVFIIIGGIKYTASGGDPSAVGSAKNTIMAAVIGLVIAVLARPIVMFVVSRL